MLNSQFPYNQLPRLQDIAMEPDPALRNACKKCWKSLQRLHGYIDAYSTGELDDVLLLLQIADAKYSFELDKEPVSFARLFEALSSENLLNDKVIKMIVDYTAWYASAGKPDLHELRPVYFHSYRKSQDLFRDKKPIQVKSYHTNLALYTAPDQPSAIKILRDDLNTCLRRNMREDELVHMSLCHFQLRAVSPYSVLNDHIARTYSQLWTKSADLNCRFLPLSKIISERRETYQALMREVANHRSYADWCLHFIDIVDEAAQYLLDRLKAIQTLKKTALDMMAKYTEYPLPAEELLLVIFSRPYIKPKYLVNALGCHRQTAYTYLGHLVKAGLLIEKKSGRETLFLHKQLSDALSK